MKKLLLALGIVALMCSPAMAGRNAGGAMLLHVNNALVYSQLQPYCDDTAYPLPPTCDELVTGVTNDPTANTMVWMVGAFPDAASPGVNAYQVGLAGDVTADYFQDFAPCGPGFFEIPDATWPGGGAGTAVAYSATINSRLFKMYWFAVGAPGVGSSMSTTNYPNGDHHAEWADDSTPPATDFVDLFGTISWGGAGEKNCPPNIVTGACCLPDGTCRDVASDACGSIGGIYHGDGTNCGTTQCPPPVTGACCATSGACTVTTEIDCAGAWQGPDTNCDPNNCPQPEAACCFSDGSCQNLTQDACTAQGGIWHTDGATCDTVICPPPATGACCVGQTCTIETTVSCAALGGTYKGDGTTCEPINPCIPVPTKSTTWGQIKGQYR